MKHIFTALLIALVCMVALPSMAQEKAPELKFETLRHDLGTIHEKDGKVTVEFPFTNDGNANLVITSAYASCGCTTPKYPEGPIAPGAKGVITVTYSPAGRPGEIGSTVTVRSNDKKNKKVTLRLTGLVVP
ncbi:MAG: DUF1573 domain-containing protein [Bacteroidales bacterium]|nr:DUF1573 domain-containing protein [Bacteroidales bacterium]